MLQTRNAKRTAEAAVNVAVDMVNEELIDKKTAVLRIEPDFVEHLLHPRFDEADEAKADTNSQGTCSFSGSSFRQDLLPGSAATEIAAKGEKAILVRLETSPEDLAGMVVAQGILTAHGGVTSHAAVVARGMGKCCVAGCSAITIDEEAGKMTVKRQVYKEGDYISLNGTNGNVYEGIIKAGTT
jgi:pyruvate,orthophosphate dikinase